MAASCALNRRGRRWTASSNISLGSAPCGGQVQRSARPAVSSASKCDGAGGAPGRAARRGFRNDAANQCEAPSRQEPAQGLVQVALARRFSPSTKETRSPVHERQLESGITYPGWQELSTNRRTGRRGTPRASDGQPAAVVRLGRPLRPAPSARSGEGGARRAGAFRAIERMVQESGRGDKVMRTVSSRAPPDSCRTTTQSGRGSSQSYGIARRRRHTGR